MLHDDMIHGAFAPPPSPRPRRRSESRIERDTPILPHVVAEAVWEEASTWLGARLPRAWIGELATRAETVYARNARFRRRLRSGGSEGRDWLWAFTRHWLAALLHEHKPHLHDQLPASFSNGADLSSPG